MEVVSDRYGIASSIGVGATSVEFLSGLAGNLIPSLVVSSAKALNASPYFFVATVISDFYVR